MSNSRLLQTTPADGLYMPSPSDRVEDSNEGLGAIDFNVVVFLGARFRVYKGKVMTVEDINCG